MRDYRPLGTPSNVQAARLNGGEAGRQIGTSILLKVMAGDQFDLSCQAYWSSDSLGTTTADSTMLSSLISTLTAAQANMPNPEGNVVQLVSNVFSPANYAAYQSVVNDVTDPAAPRAYLNYVMFDEQMNLVPGQSGAIQVSSIGGSWHVIGTPTPISVTSSGYFGVYLSDASSLDVFFDGLHINVYQGNLLQEQHYYPFGLTFAMAESGTAVPNRYKYQGKELMSEAKLNLYDFTARQYDPQIGRFWGIDPLDQFPSGYTGMGNDPANNIDPTGMWTRANPGNPINPADGGPAGYSSEAYGHTGDAWNQEAEDLAYARSQQDEEEFRQRIDKENEGTQGYGGEATDDAYESSLAAIAEFNGDGGGDGGGDGKGNSSTTDNIKAGFLWFSQNIVEPFNETFNPLHYVFHGTYGSVTGTDYNTGQTVSRMGALATIPLAIGPEFAKGMNVVRTLGRMGEHAVGITGRKVGIKVLGKTRFPDQVTDFALTEVKNVKNLSYTQQLRDYQFYSRQQKLDFILYTRPNTVLSRPLLEQIKIGEIIHLTIPH